MKNIVIKNVSIVNEGTTTTGDVWIRDTRIEKIGSQLDPSMRIEEIDGTGKTLIPGVIDDQVHFREPGLTHKATIYTEAKAAVRGGVTSFMEMPNTNPPAFTHELLEQKYDTAKHHALANYSFLWVLPTTIWRKCYAPTTKKMMFVVLKYLWVHQPEIYSLITQFY